MDVVVLDHHRVETRPPAVAHVNPNQPDDTSELGYLCAAGVTFLFLVALNRHLRATGFYETRGIAEPDLRLFLDLVGLATICDVVPLKDVNRAFVRFGLGQLSTLSRPGLSALAGVAKREGPFTPYHLGFVFGPRINAGGRVGRSSLGVDLLTARDTAQGGRSSPSSSTCTTRERQAIEKNHPGRGHGHGGDPGQCALHAGGGRGLASRRGRHRRRPIERTLSPSRPLSPALKAAWDAARPAPFPASMSAPSSAPRRRPR